MRFTFDPDKNATNIAKHGVALDQAAALEWDEAIAAEDTREAYGEQRMVAYAPLGDRLFCCVYVDQDDETRRVISLRKANRREVTRYVEQT